MKIEVDVNDYDIINAICNRYIKEVGFDKLKSEVVNKLSKEIKSDILCSKEVQDKINKSVLTATASVTGRINQKSEELIQSKLNQLMNKKLEIKIGN